jgi:dTDP-4-amino-4,6-dideoxygalactose transaminase
MTNDIPFLRPNPPKLSELAAELSEIEASHIYSNYGPVNTRLEQSVIRDLFGGQGACVSVCNATIGLMLAIRLAIGPNPDLRRRYALMPSFTFAATGHAAIWCGLTPLLCDIEPDTWLVAASAEEEMIARYGDQIAVIVPYATFGNNLNLERYRGVSESTGIPVVIDAAASLGSLDDRGNTFGTDFSQPLVYSMHVTKTFATSEAGLIYCADKSVVDTLRAMGNFGFEHPRTATVPGLNSKLSEIAALLALRKLQNFDAVVGHRLALVNRYRDMLADWTFQRRVGRSYAYQFVSVLPPGPHAERRTHILEQLSASGIGFGKYFDPHLADQQYFRAISVSGDLSATNRIARQIISLPLSDFMTEQDVERVCGVLQQACKQL